VTKHDLKTGVIIAWENPRSLESYFTTWHRLEALAVIIEYTVTTTTLQASITSAQGDTA